MLWFIILIAILTIAIMILINKKTTKKPTMPEKDAYGASFGDCSLDLEEMLKKAEEKRTKYSNRL